MALLVTGLFPVSSLPFQSEPLRECCHSRLSENVLNKSLDSGLRRNDGGRAPACAGMVIFPPSSFQRRLACMDAGVSINDGRGCGQAFIRHGKGLSGWQSTCFLLVVIPAKAGIQEGKPGR